MMIISLLIFSAGCHSAATNTPNHQSKLSNRVVAESYPLQFLTQRIVGDEIQVEFPAGQSVDPKSWNPQTRDVADMQKADLIVVNGPGADYAQWLVHVSLPESKVCQTSDNIKLSEFVSVSDYRIVHSHGPEGQHSHPFMVPYTWLDPKIAKKQADKIADSLKKIYPQRAELFDIKLAALQADLDQLAQEIDQIAAAANKTVLTANPNLKFLTRAAGIRDVHMLWFELPDEAEFDEAVIEFEARAKFGEDTAATMLLTEQPNKPLIELLERKSISAVVLDPLDKPPHQGDYLSVMRDNIQQLKSAK